MERRRALARAGIAAICLAATPQFARAQLRIVSLNASNSAPSNAGPRTGMDTILSAIGSTVSDDPTLLGNTGIAKKIDVLCLQEFNAPGTTGAQYASLLNSMYGTTSFSYGTLAGATTGSGTQGIIYNSATVQLLDSLAVGTSSSTGQPRQALRYHLRPVGYTSADFYVYNSHYKSGDDSDDRDRRLDEANAVRTNADALGSGARIIHLGDFNSYFAQEPGYQKLLSAGTAQLLDPINQSGTWSDSSSFKSIHTQSPWNSNFGSSGFTGGGMDDRFDQQLITSALNDHHGLAYITNSYQAFGNNGSHVMNQPIDSGTGAGSATLHAEASILDHLPVVADYQLPAKMSVSVASLPSQVIVGASVPVNVTVTNSAPVQFTVGADGLDYSVSSSGALSGSANATNLAALAAGNNHALTLSASALGTATGTVSVNSTSQEVANGVFSQNISTQVIDHSQPSFAVGSNVTTAIIDFGIKGRGLGGGTASFTISNRFGNGTTASLDLDSIAGAGSTAQLTTNAATFSNLAAGSGQSFTATINASSNGTLSATYTFNLSDQDLAGAISRGPLTLILQGIVATPGDANLNGQIDGNDYARVDSSFNAEHTGGNIGGWANGDFDGNGKVDGTDYAYIDSSFSAQSGSLARALAILDGADPMPDDMNTPGLAIVLNHFEEFGNPYRAGYVSTLPETSSLLIPGIAFLSLNMRRQRGRDLSDEQAKRSSTLAALAASAYPAT